MSHTNRHMDVYLLHHTHTDIGYTDAGDSITEDHIHYIRESLRLADSHAGVRWICETLWGVERFLDRATPEETAAFVRLVKEGKLSLSGSYLNMTEAIDGDVLLALMKRMHSRISDLGLTAPVALTSDVNGYSWGFADLLAECGVHTLISQLNSTHGREPFDRRQTPFVWESPTGKSITVWVAEHYNMGNWTGMEPYLCNTLEESLAIAEEKLPAYLDALIEGGYPYDFLPLGVSGVFYDNAPPNGDIAPLIDAWNRKHGDQIAIHMATLEDFVLRVNTIRDTLPVYRGDWTDWWADGISSTPAALKLFRDAQRIHLGNRALDPDGTVVPASLTERAEYDLTLYAEHTWGHHASVSEPWREEVAELDAKKSWYATDAHLAAKQARTLLFDTMGQAKRERAPLCQMRAINPFDESMTLPLSWEATYRGQNVFPDADCLTDERGNAIPVQFSGNRLWATLSLPPHSNTVYTAEQRKLPPINPVITLSGSTAETPHYRIVTDETGVISLFHKDSGRELIEPPLTDGHETAAFCPIYETTPSGNKHPCHLRSSMGMSRRNGASLRDPGKVRSVTVGENGAVFGILILEYALEGTSLARVEWTFYRDSDRIDVRFLLHKESRWNPENVYLSLPFTGAGTTLWADKTAACFRPGLDGLPRSCRNFYSLATGTAFSSPEGTVAVAFLDAPLLWLGDLRSAEAAEMDGDVRFNRAPAYSWVMNNFWETNFRAEIGGFHSFRYLLRPMAPIAPADALARLKTETLIPPPFPVHNP